MSLIRCPFCGAFVTDRDAVCWHCEGTLKEEGTAAAPVHTKGFRHTMATAPVDDTESSAVWPSGANGITEGFRRTTVASSAVNAKASEVLSESPEATPVAASLPHGFRYTTPSQTPAEVPDDSHKVCRWAGGFRQTSSACSPAAGNVKERVKTKENDPFLDTLPSIDISEYVEQKANNTDIKEISGKSASHMQADKASGSSFAGDGDDAESEVYVKRIHRSPAEDPDETNETRFMILLAAVIGVIVAALLLFFVFPRL